MIEFLEIIVFFFVMIKSKGKQNVVYIFGRKQGHVMRVVWKSAPCAIQMQVLKRKLVAFIA
jgi:hypothetical protein